MGLKHYTSKVVCLPSTNRQQSILSRPKSKQELKNRHKWDS